MHDANLTLSFALPVYIYAKCLVLSFSILQAANSESRFTFSSAGFYEVSKWLNGFR